MNARLFSLIVLSAACFFCTHANCQVPYQLSFEFTPATATDPPSYSWVSGAFPVATTSPGGTEVFFVERVSFSSFAEFHDDVIGTWQLNGLFTMGSFDISAVLESEFPMVELTHPVAGQQFLSGTNFQIEISPDNFPSTGTNVQSNPNEVMVEFLEILEVRFTLLEGVHHSVPLIGGRGGYVRDGLLSNIRDEALGFEISPNVKFTGNSVLVPIIIFLPLIGDVNLDGVISLLDIAPFIDRVISGVYQFEADINEDGSVDLLDVAPFIEILT